MMQYAHAPIHDGYEYHRDTLFAVKDTQREVPLQSHPFHRRTQDNQGYRPNCTVYSFCEVLENKVFWDTGTWFSITEFEKLKLWEYIKTKGLGGENWGAPVNSPIIACKDFAIKMINRAGSITVKVKDYFVVAYKSDPLFLEKVKLEIYYGGGVCSGLNNARNYLDYYEALDSPYIIKPSKTPKPIAHACAFTAYNETPLLPISGSWGNDVADNGVLYVDQKHLKDFFVPYGFTYEKV